VLDSPQLHADLVARGKKQAARYSWRRMAEQTLEVYNRALKG
jgi:glycosyltransferase involved in cell wall biosynthesis